MYHPLFHSAYAVQSFKVKQKLNKSTFLIQPTYTQQKNPAPPIKLCSSSTFGSLTRGLTHCQYCVSPRFVSISSSARSLFNQPQKFQSFKQDFIPAPLYFELMSFLNVVIIAPQLASQLHTQGCEELRGGGIWKPWGIDSGVGDRHTCDCVSCTNRLFGENRLQVCEDCINVEHSEVWDPLQVWTRPGMESPEYRDFWVGQFCQG